MLGPRQIGCDRILSKVVLHATGNGIYTSVVESLWLTVINNKYIWKQKKSHSKLFLQNYVFLKDKVENTCPPKYVYILCVFTKWSKIYVRKWIILPTADRLWTCCCWRRIAIFKVEKCWVHTEKEVVWILHQQNSHAIYQRVKTGSFWLQCLSCLFSLLSELSYRLCTYSRSLYC